MTDRFELSLKNKVVRMWLIIMVPALIVEIVMIQFTNIPVFTAIPWGIFFVWLYFHKRKEKRENITCE